jgi:hypothetical protein
MLGLRVWVFFPGKLNLNIGAFITLIFQLQRVVILGGWPLLGKKRVMHYIGRVYLTKSHCCVNLNGNCLPFLTTIVIHMLSS